MRSWKEIRKILHKLTGKPEIYFEILCDYTLIELCVKGLSVKDIACFSEEDEPSVRYTLMEYLGFTGFEDRLAFSPLLWYDSLEDINDSIYTNTFLKELVEKFMILKERIERNG